MGRLRGAQVMGTVLVVDEERVRMSGPLDGVRVIDLTHVLNGPFGCVLLAHLGAEVIKVEPREGDRYRRAWMPAGVRRDSYAFMAVNSNKRSVTLNLKSERGKELLRELVAGADVLVENFSAGVLDRLGFGYEVLSELNPRLVYAFSRGFGDSGPYAHVRSNAAINMAMTGWTACSQEMSGARNRGILGVGDEASGVSMALGICAALYERERSGRGQMIEISMQEALLGFMSGSLHGHFEGIHPASPPKRCLDGDYSISLTAMSDDQMVQLLAAMGISELAGDERFATVSARRANSAELETIFSQWIEGRTRSQVWEAMSAAGISSGPVLSLGEVLEDEHLNVRGAFVEVEHPEAGNIKLVAPWIRFSETPAEISRVAPTLGQDNHEVYGNILGLQETELAQLEHDGVI